MVKDERSLQKKGILKALREKRVDPATIQRIEDAIATASIRPLRVLYECCVSGGISTETLTKKYGYNQPPRAARDLRELGFHLTTSFDKTSDGRRMAVYSIDNFDSFSAKEGRAAFSKQEKAALFTAQSGKCFYCRGSFASNALQIDHRIPFEIVGNKLHKADGLGALIVVCSSCNRSKSWSCESCRNFTAKREAFCRECYWFDPDHYRHVAGQKRALVNLTFEKGDAGFKRFFGKDRDTIRKIIEK